MITRFALLVLLLAAGSVSATDYHVHPTSGDDRNDGQRAESAWRSLRKLREIRPGPGDRILLASGQVFTDELRLRNVSGSVDNPVVVTSYPGDGRSGRAVIDASGLPSAIHIINSSHLRISNLELSADGGEATWRARDKGMRAAVLIELTGRGHHQDIHLHDLSIHDVFFENRGFVRGTADVGTANGTQNYGFGIRVLGDSGKATLTGLAITNSTVTRVSHTGIKIDGGGHQGIREVRIENNRVLDPGGPGMQMSRVRDMVMRDNVIDGSGSTKDPRNWGRGSGTWTWKSEDVLIEKNAFLNSSGPADSAGVHIDFGCRNVIVQYNLSANNAGGFYEVLGDNHNTAYRYNISINDGYRVKGRDGAFQEGKVFWLSGYVGQKRQESGPFNSYFYNNTIFVDDAIVTRVAIARTAEGVLIANNIFYILGGSEALTGNRYKRAPADYDAGTTVFRNNLFLRAEDWPAGTGLRDGAPVIGDPGFVVTDAMKIGDFRPTNVALVADRGLVLEPIPGDPVGLPGGLAVSHDILGNPIDGLPDLGAIEISGTRADD